MSATFHKALRFLDQTSFCHEVHELIENVDCATFGVP